MARNRLGYKRWNDLEDRIVLRLSRVADTIEEKLNADGVPPFHEPNSPREQYNHLLALRNANSDLYWNDPEAIDALASLSQRYGMPPAPGMAIPPFPAGNPMTPYEGGGS